MILRLFAALALSVWFATVSRADVCPLAGDTQGMPDVQTGSVRLFYKLLKPFDATKKTLLVINGGPGGDHSLIEAFHDAGSRLGVNVVSFDHRGVGCTTFLAPQSPAYEPGLYAIKRAGEDLHALHDQLVGADTKWLVYGVSYGTMLGQRYVLDHQNDVEALVLDSAFHKSAAIDIARHQYKANFIDAQPESKALMALIVAKYPDAEAELLRRIWGRTYSYAGRTQEIPKLFREILDAPSADVAHKLYSAPVYHGPTGGLTYDVLCEEIWDHHPDAAYDDYYFADFAANCPAYAQSRTPMDWTEDLKGLKVRTFIWAGAFDPVTPARAMREMQTLIPGALLFENAYAGHGLFFEKPACALDLMQKFYGGASDDELNTMAAAAACQSAPRPENERSRAIWLKSAGGLAQPAFRRIGGPLGKT